MTNYYERLNSFITHAIDSKEALIFFALWIEKHIELFEFDLM